eukprot:gnl/Ergobibamus_cyprinoides/513.p2 GENE.gnl/Ergobibamus_cyprinoides/513~~gnl/Ergobibamus_cyprinoides/513.p2  ORF type:complete len:268 (-),score=58.59 gnl/Ergobibamus_cyprinoides/513:21-824(-)
MELSALLFYRDRLYACGDRTGIVYEIRNFDALDHELPEDLRPRALPRHVLLDGDGVTNNKGFKCEWATEYHGQMLWGSFGKEFADPVDGSYVSDAPMWVKFISPEGHVTSTDWQSQYTSLREATGNSFPAYLLHESGHFSPAHGNRWFFLPRRECATFYNEKNDQHEGTNLILSVDEHFTPSSVAITRIGGLGTHTERGFSAFRFVPGSLTDIVALRTEEIDDTTANATGVLLKSYITIVTTDGEILLPETFIGLHKFEGIAIRGRE